MEFHKPSELLQRGVVLPAPDAVHVAEDVSLDRLAAGCILHPGARVSGSRTVLGCEAEVGREGPARIHNVAMARGAVISSGTAENCVLLEEASLGPNAHVREGSILEELASTGHAVGLKQSIILSFGTLGSLINFCDCLLAGGTSRQDHSEVGSGFIHFNFTPFGRKGDKATASLFGDVTRGVFLDQERIFLGGSGGVVGPVQIDYGTTLAAGSVYRRDYASGLLVYGEKTVARSRPFNPLHARRFGQRVRRSVTYIGQLMALQAWYRKVRLGRSSDPLQRLVLEHADSLLSGAVAERIKQVQRFLDGATPADSEAEADWKQTMAWWERLSGQDAFTLPPNPESELLEHFLTEAGPISTADHLTWVQSLSSQARTRGQLWLKEIASLEIPS